jgi:hypothetical protein
MTHHASIPPFWERLPSFALYPLKGSALAALIVFSLLITLTSLIPFVGWLLALLFWLGAYKQAFEMLVSTAHGRMDVPAATFDVGNGMVMQYLVLQVVVMAIPFFAGEMLGGSAAFITMLLVGLLTPAATIGLAISGHLMHALNPLHLMALVSRIGWAYVAMVGLTLVIPWTALDAQGLLSQWMPALAADALGTVLSIWALFATFHLMGYVVWQYHEALGFSPDPRLNPGGMTAARDADLLARAHHFIAEGELDAAITLMRHEVRDRAVDPPVHDLYRRTLKLKNDPKLLLEHAGMQLPVLVMAKQDRKALALIRESIAIDPHFAPFERDDAERLANAALHAGQTDVALALFRCLLERHEGHARYPEWALQASDLSVRRGEDLGAAHTWLDRAAVQSTDEDERRRIAAQRIALST